LLGEQSRPHSDLDIVVQDQDVPRIRALLEERGYTEVPRDDTRTYNFVMGDGRGHAVDIHTYTFDEQGRNVYDLDYLPEMLTGHGNIAGHPVKCIPPDWMVNFHSGYELDENDYQDVRLLCTRFGFPIPKEFEGFRQNEKRHDDKITR
jgi:lincosamide nucleotidyltransferase A/C/D/E